MVVALKQMHIAGPKMGPTVASRLAVQQSQHKNVVFLVSLHDGYNKFGWFPENMDFCPQKQDFFAQKSAFYYAAPMLAPLFWARPDPNQWDHKFSILWGTLDAFGFSVDAHSASWRAVLCLQFPKMTLFGAKTIPDICHGRHGRRPCKFFLPGVKFSRLNAKNLPFYTMAYCL